MISQKSVCPICQGKGKIVEVRKTSLDDRFSKSEKHEVNCPRCKGSGKGLGTK